ncbi:tRNA1(Val) (adenine(37)-N6)-methyltransferase [Methylobacterium planeticum]|uniref:Methyltransferase n=1 Tax=Methylobacterium planeticum TaxID=2615211 RepID=A0A6N6MIH1_9HYPH|nr:methyltransferase [Methylobacterium planeticum]KAB1070855.1 methyltransferase [Methylobacterium planeticum]
MSPDAEPDLFLGGALRLHQPPRGAHRAGTDAALLAHLVVPGDGALVCDVGAGTGAVGLGVARLHPSCRVVLVEREPDLVALAARNVRENELDARARVIAADVLAPGSARHAAGLTPGLADVVVTNPPFFDTRRGRPSPNPEKACAHTFASGGLETWLRTCTDLLRPGGRLGLIHRADALPDCLDALRGRFGAVAVRPVHARAERPAIRILVTAVKGSRAPLRLLPPLVLQAADGRFTPEAEALHRARPRAGSAPPSQ